MRILDKKLDEALVRRVLAGHTADFGHLVKKYLSMVQAVIRGQLGFSSELDDLAQETFFAAFRTLHQLREPARFPCWLATIARNLCHQHRTAAARATRVNDDYFATVETATEQDPERQEIYVMLKQALSRLEPEHREVLLLFYYSGQSLRDIERSLGITREAAKKRLQRARAALGKQMEAHLGLLANEQRPQKAQAKRIASAAILLAPDWTPAPASAGLTEFILTHTLGGKAMLLNAFIAAGLVAAGALAITSTGGRIAPPTAPPVVMAAQAVSPPAPPTPAALDTAEAALAQPPPAPTPEAAPAPPKPKSVPAAKRTMTAGGNAQRTGYYAVPAPTRQPRIVWEAPLGEAGSFPGSIAVVDQNGQVFAAYAEGRQTFFAAFSPEGTRLWTHGPEKGGRLSAPLLLTNGHVAKGLGAGLTAFAADSGEMLWQDSNPPTNGSPVADSQGNIYLDAFERLYKLQGDTGKVLWDIEGSGSTAPSTTLSLDERTVYIGKHALEEFPAGLIAVNAADGTVRWNFLPVNHPKYKEDGFIGNWASPVAGAADLVYLQDVATGDLYAVADRGDHPELLWTYDPLWTGNEVREEHRKDGVTFNGFPLRAKDSPRTVATDGEAVYLGVFGYPASVHALNADGSLRWKQPLEGDVVVGSPAVTASAVYVLGGGDDKVPGVNALYCLDKKTGVILWQTPVAKAHGDVGESIAFAPDGTIYVATGGLEGHAVLMALR